jgi:hypothetical protein
VASLPTKEPARHRFRNVYAGILSPAGKWSVV